MSYYGCVNEPGNLDINEGSYPGGYTPEQLGMANLPTGDEECESEDDFKVPMVNGNPKYPFDELGEDTEEYSGEWCYCQSNQCNGAENNKVAAAAALALVLSLTVAAGVV